MKIAVTGASGFLGGYLVSRLLGSGHDLFLLTRSLDRIDPTAYPAGKVTWLETDYSPDSLNSLVLPVDAMVHLASKKYHPGQKMFSDYEINLTVSGNVFKVCETQNIKNVIFSSSRSVYSSLNRLPFSEEDDVFPENPYAVSKLKIEKISDTYDINCKSLRISQLIGWGEREGFMFKTFLNRAMEKKPITIFGQGSGTRDYLYAKDAARAIEKAIQYPHIKGVFNVGSGHGTRHLEFAELIAAVFSDNESPVVVDRDKKEDPCHYRLNIDKFRTCFSWEPCYTLREALEDMKKEDFLQTSA
jgi:nucleoside-diphosphate-sugar epimerase